MCKKEVTSRGRLFQTRNLRNPNEKKSSKQLVYQDENIFPEIVCELIL